MREELLYSNRGDSVGQLSSARASRLRSCHDTHTLPHSQTLTVTLTHSYDHTYSLTHSHTPSHPRALTHSWGSYRFRSCHQGSGFVERQLLYSHSAFQKSTSQRRAPESTRRPRASCVVARVNPHNLSTYIWYIYICLHMSVYIYIYIYIYGPCASCVSCRGRR